MKVTELMIGDWVQVPSELNRYKKIETAFDMDNAYLYEPISLTPDILEKNGFVINRGITSWKFETDGGDLIDIYGVEDYHLSINIEDTKATYGKGYRWLLRDLVIFYVHQLQHAFCLCGIDHKITL